MQSSPAERVFSPLLEHLTHLLRAHGAMRCSTVYTTPSLTHQSDDSHCESDPNHEAIDQPQASLDHHHHDTIASLALISHQSLVAGCGLLRSGKIFYGQSLIQSWFNLMYSCCILALDPILPLTLSSSCLLPIFTLPKFFISWLAITFSRQSRYSRRLVPTPLPLPLHNQHCQ